MRRVSLAAAAVVLMLGLTGASSGAGPIDWKHLPYLLYETQQMLLTTDGSWEHARVVKPIQPGQRPPTATGFFEKQGVKIGYIWAPTCLNGRQSVTMTKTFYALGRPIKGSLFFTPGFGAPLPFIGADVLVNNRSVGYLGNTNSLKAKRYIQADLSADALSSFRYGTNKLTIRIDKMALPKGEACNNKNRLIGALMQLSLFFQPDLVAVPSPKGLEETVRRAPGTVVGALGTLKFVNRGPSASAGGKLILRISGNVNVETAWTPGTVQVSPPFHDCEGQGHGVAVQGIITCPFSGFPAGLSESIFVITGGRLTPNFPPTGSTNLSIDWQIVTTGYDLHAENNASSHNFIICGPQSTEARCIGAK